MEKILLKTCKKIIICNNVYALQPIDYLFTDGTFIENGTFIYENDKGEYIKIPYCENEDYINDKHTNRICYCEYIDEIELVSKYGKENIKNNITEYIFESTKIATLLINNYETKKFEAMEVSIDILKCVFPMISLHNFFAMADDLPAAGFVDGMAIISENAFNMIKDELKNNDISTLKNIFDILVQGLEEQKLALKENYKAPNVIPIDNKEYKNISYNEAINKLNDLVGLKNIKGEINELSNYLKFISKTKDTLNIDKPNLNMVFTGNPGTGKTTVAKIIAVILNKLGFTQENKIIECTSRDFIGQYVGLTAIKTHELLEKAKGGIIFIDEAYSFASSGNSFAQEALAEILKEMEKPDTIFILSGYKKEMENFIKTNSGIASRIGGFFDFKDYNLEELMSMFLNKVKSTKMKLDDDCKEKIENIINEEMKIENFGNGRYIDNLFNKIIKLHATNTFESNSLDELSTITINDIDSNLFKETSYKDKQYEIGFKK